MAYQFFFFCDFYVFAIFRKKFLAIFICLRFFEKFWCHIVDNAVFLVSEEVKKCLFLRLGAPFPSYKHFSILVQSFGSFTWKVLREFWYGAHFIAFDVLFLNLNLRPRIFAAILEKWRPKSVFWQYLLSDIFYNKNNYIQNVFSL